MKNFVKLDVINRIPRLTAQAYKGQSGKVAIVGGSLEYTGAPYYSAISALRTGSDLCHIICSPDSSSIIKSYAPELVVYPYLDHKSNYSSEILNILNRVNCIVIGPGLGRHPKTLSLVSNIIQETKNLNLPLIIDADGLFLIQNNPSLIRNYSKTILTPNINEFKKLLQVTGLEFTDKDSDVMSLSSKLGVTILKKGHQDIIASNGIGKLAFLTIESNLNLNFEFQSCLKRCGGQGDLLTGILSTFVGWFLKSIEESDDKNIFESLALSCHAAGMVLKVAAGRAFEVRGRSLVASDIIPFIGPSFESLFDPKSRH
ncbi:carbohydrate kinase [Globomyces pollinis-pini]|nr:carbohydrate kinase [Globomyces pollinis-pini]